MAGLNKIAGKVYRLPCVGGTESDVSAERVHTFNADGNLAVLYEPAAVDYLVVAGGGAGGGGGSTFAVGGGGGAGGLLSGTARSLTRGTKAIVVGDGAPITTNYNPSSANGSNSTFDGLTAIGGKSGPADGGAAPAGTGGSGCGGTGYATTTGNDGGTAGTSGQGHAGGAGRNVSADVNNNAGGGGGAGDTGQAQHDSTYGGAGGIGVEWPSGSGVYYAGGGGGGSNTAGRGGAGGSSVGGAGGGGAASNGSAGTANRGAGGGGAGAAGTGGGTKGGAGGKGVVIVRYTKPSLPSKIMGVAAFEVRKVIGIATSGMTVTGQSFSINLGAGPTVTVLAADFVSSVSGNTGTVVHTISTDGGSTYGTSKALGCPAGVKAIKLKSDDGFDTVVQNLSVTLADNMTVC